MTKTMTEDRLRQALFDPATIFSSPTAVVNDQRFLTKDKIEILRRWEYDEREERVAVEEGFPAREPNALLDTIFIALHRLGTGPDVEHSPSTKQGGV
jgi:hypothetical protein